MPARSIRRGVRAYTLVEVLVVVTVMGIAGAMVIPALSQTNSLQVQGAVRLLIADLTVAQSDAIAFQEGRGVVFDTDAESSRYTVAEVRGTTFDPDLNAIIQRDFAAEGFNHSRIVATSFGDDTLFFDELGGPVASAGSDTPSAGGYIDVEGSGMRFRVNIEPFTGRITVVDRNRAAAEEPEAEPEPTIIEPEPPEPD